MIELFKVIKDYFEKRKLKKLLERRLIMSDNKIDIKDNQYMINGRVIEDTEVVDNMFKWACDNFVFRNNDVYLPNAPMPIFGLKTMTMHDDIDVEKFISKFGNYALKYLMYNAFVAGYDAGIARAENDQKDYIHKTVNEYVENKIKPVENEKPKKNPPKKKQKKIEQEPVVQEEIKEEIMTPPIIEEEKKPEIKQEPIVQEEIKEESPDGELLDSYAYNDNNELVIDSEKYKPKTYEKYISNVIENKLNKFGMTVSDIKIAGFPTYVLGELMIEVENADAINEDQKAIKQVFYDYISKLHEELTKKNTTV